MQTEYIILFLKLNFSLLSLTFVMTEERRTVELELGFDPLKKVIGVNCKRTLSNCSKQQFQVQALPFIE